MPEPQKTPTPAPRGARNQPPFTGFRVIFAVINGMLWFALAGAVSLGASFSLVAADRLSPSALATGAATAAFFASFFGMPGALTGFLGLAAGRRFALPPEEEWGEGRLANIWMHGFIYGLMFGPLAYGGAVLAGGHGAIGRGTFCLVVAGAGAVAGAAQAFVIAGTAALGDLGLSRRNPPALSTRWLLVRAGVPQGLGNGAITALIALGSVPAGAKAVNLPLAALVGDAAGTGLVVALFMAFSAGGLAAADRRYGRVGPADVRPATPAKKMLESFVASLVCAFAALVVGFATSGVGLPPAAYAGWKALVGGVVGAVMAMRAAGWGVAATDAAAAIRPR